MDSHTRLALQQKCGAEPAYNAVSNPELVQCVNGHIQTGHFHDADELIEKALDALEGQAVPPRAPSAEPKNLVELFAPLRGQFTDEEVDTLCSRNRSTARPIDLA